MKIYSIRDRIADVYNTPFFLANDNVAVRALRDIYDDPSSSIAHHPEDYDLVSLGSFYPDTGKIDVQSPELIYSGTNLLPVYPPDDASH